MFHFGSSFEGHMMEEKSAPTSTPPGRFIDERFNTESKRELVSTFHLFCCTLSTTMAHTHTHTWRLNPSCITQTATSIILPTTTSPISPLYLGRGRDWLITSVGDEQKHICNGKWWYVCLCTETSRGWRRSVCWLFPPLPQRTQSTFPLTRKYHGLWNCSTVEGCDEQCRSPNSFTSWTPCLWLSPRLA